MPEHNWMQSLDSLEPIPVLGEHVVARLRRAIIAGDLPVGTHLVEAKLSARFNVSRGPIRDALRRLQTEGLVEPRGRGLAVRGLTLDDLEELYLVRELIESTVMRRCCEIDNADLTAVKMQLDRMRAAYESGDREQFARADLEFHTAFYEVAGYRRLSSIWAQQRPTFAEVLAVTNAQDGDLAPTLRDHELLLEAASARDIDRTLELLHSHIRGSLGRMRAAYADIAGPSAV